MTEHSFYGSGYFPKEWNVVNNNSPNRVAFTWNSNTTETSSTLDSDLDLHLVNSSGVEIASSASCDGNVEFLEYTPSAGDGDLTIKIYGWDVPADLYT